MKTKRSSQRSAGRLQALSKDSRRSRKCSRLHENGLVKGAEVIEPAQASPDLGGPYGRKVQMADHKIRRVKVLDPRHERETFINAPISIYVNNGIMYLTLGTERPVANETGPAREVEHEVGVRLVIPLNVAGIIAAVIQKQIAALTQPQTNATKQ
jgi:hypothetical protein